MSWGDKLGEGLGNETCENHLRKGENHVLRPCGEERGMFEDLKKSDWNRRRRQESHHAVLNRPYSN